MTDEKRQAIKNTKRLTKERRKDKTIRVYKVKVDRSHLSKSRYHHLKMLFVEAKWLYNHMVGSDCIFTHDYKLKDIPVMNRDREFENRTIRHLSSQMRQAIVDGTKQNVFNLAKSKAAGRSVGRLRCVRSYDSIPLKQHAKNGTYFISSKNRIRLQGMKTHIHVRGLRQLGENPDVANAKLVRHGDDFYFHITVYESPMLKENTGKVVGIDLGIKDTLITSDGDKYKIHIPESPRLKKLQRRFNRRTKKGSNNRYKLRKRIQKEYRRIGNRKSDQANKIVSKLTQEYDLVAFQDESLRGWHSGLFGRTVQASVLGRIKSALKRKAETAIMVDRFFPSTKLCPLCGKLHESITLNDRWYDCQCGYSEDRDVKSAITILMEGLNQAGREPISLMPVEGSASAPATRFVEPRPGISTCPVKQEAHAL